MNTTKIFNACFTRQSINMSVQIYVS